MTEEELKEIEERLNDLDTGYPEDINNFEEHAPGDISKLIDGFRKERKRRDEAEIDLWLWLQEAQNLSNLIWSYCVRPFKRAQKTGRPQSFDFTVADKVALSSMQGIRRFKNIKRGKRNEK